MGYERVQVLFYLRTPDVRIANSLLPNFVWNVSKIRMILAAVICKCFSEEFVWNMNGSSKCLESKMLHNPNLLLFVSFYSMRLFRQIQTHSNRSIEYRILLMIDIRIFHTLHSDLKMFTVFIRQHLCCIQGIGGWLPISCNNLCKNSKQNCHIMFIISSVFLLLYHRDY